MLERRNLKLDAVLEFRVPEEELVAGWPGVGAPTTPRTSSVTGSGSIATRPHRCWTTTTRRTEDRRGGRQSRRGVQPALQSLGH